MDSRKNVEVLILVPIHFEQGRLTYKSGSISSRYRRNDFSSVSQTRIRGSLCAKAFPLFFFSARPPSEPLNMKLCFLAGHFHILRSGPYHRHVMYGGTANAREGAPAKSRPSRFFISLHTLDPVSVPQFICLISPVLSQIKLKF